MCVAAMAAAAMALAPGASATDCGLPASLDSTMNPSPLLDVTGFIPQSLNGDYVQVPFTVPSGVTAIQIRYSYDQPGATTADPGICGSGPNTLDMGVYGPKQAGETYWHQGESRGWSGSAVKNIAISADGFNSDSAYNGNRKGFFSGYTTRAYQPGPMTAGTWAVELGAGWIDPSVNTAGIQYHVQVAYSTDSTWTQHAPDDDPYDGSIVANPSSGWYSGDLHVHGEMEPGNATRTQTFNLGFGAPPTGGGLDFITQVDHNNDITAQDLGSYQAAHPDKLIIPGVEETTYHGHYMNSGSGILSDFHTSSIYLLGNPTANPDVDPANDLKRGAVAPSQFFSQIQQAGGYTEINHPSTAKDAPAACRGCAWTYSDADTDFSKVDAVEVQNAAEGWVGDTAPNPFTPDAIAYYEHALDSGAHIAAVGGSDDHKGGEATGFADSSVGSPATMVHASSLSEGDVVDAIRQDHTYVKFFGVSSPTIDLMAKTKGSPDAGIGDTASGPSAALTATVSGASSTGRSGAFELDLLKDGQVMQKFPFTGDGTTKNVTVKDDGRYALQVTRTTGSGPSALTFVEDYSSPIWFVSNAVKVLSPKTNPKKGTGAVRAKVPGPGKLVLSGKGTKKGKFTAKKAGTVKMPVKLAKSSQTTLKRKGKLTLKLTVAYTPTGGKTSKTPAKITLRKK